MKENYVNQTIVFKDKIKNKLQEIGGTNITGTVYEAMLNEANLSRNQGNVKLTVEKYKRLLNDKKCEIKVKKKALLNLASYMNINLMDVDGAIQLFDEYYNSYNFCDDIDITKLYTQYLWSSDTTGKAKACDILERYFTEKKHKKTAVKNLELFAITVTYCINNVLENVPVKLKVRAEQRIFNEYSKELYDFVIEKQLAEFRPSVRHNISLALIQTAKLAIELSDEGYNRLEYVNAILEYGNNQFNEIFKKQLKRLYNDINQSDFENGELVMATVTYLPKYGALVKIGNNQKALIHNSEMTREQKKQLKVGKTIKTRVIGKSEKGYMLTLKI